MGSSTVKAQKLANEANIQIAQETNALNRQLASEANELNYRMFNEQNSWNEVMWNKQNEYNDPSAQLARYMKAGINPIWAMSDPSSGNASQLSSTEAKPAEVAQMQRYEVKPEYDPYLAQHIQNINNAANNILKGVQGFIGLDLQAQDVQTRRNAQVTRSGLDLASAAEVRAATQGRELENQWSLSTLGIRINSESQKLHNMEAQYRNMEANTDEAKSKKLLIDEQKNFMSQQLNYQAEQLQLRKRELGILQQNANTNARSVDVQESKYKLEDERFSAEIKQWNNENLLNFMKSFGSYHEVEGKGGFSAGGFNIQGSAKYHGQSPADLSKVYDCGILLLQRAAENPGDEKTLQQAAEAAKILDLQRNEMLKRRARAQELDRFNSSTSSIPNPSEDWLP